MQYIKTLLLNMIWVRAHHQMATGTSAPADWLDIEKAGMSAMSNIV